LLEVLFARNEEPAGDAEGDHDDRTDRDGDPAAGTATAHSTTATLRRRCQTTGYARLAMRRGTCIGMSRDDGDDAASTSTKSSRYCGVASLRRRTAFQRRRRPRFVIGIAATAPASSCGHTDQRGATAMPIPPLASSIIASVSATCIHLPGSTPDGFSSSR